MPHRDVVVIGASSGGVEGLITLLTGLPDDLPAAIFVVLHVRPDFPSQLPAILNRVGALPAAHAVDGEPIRRGRVFIAPPGLQTYLHRGRIGVRRGPQENMHRPAIDPLFRTAAHHYGPRVIGIIMSGALDDGAAGLAAIRRAGGLAIVQDPEDAPVRDMPLNAMQRAGADRIVPIIEMPRLLIDLISQETGTDLAAEVPLETVEEAGPKEPFLRSEQAGTLANVTCPECQGNLWESRDASGIRFRCRVGHAYSETAIDAAQSQSVERALWSALKALEERVALTRRLAAEARARGHEAIATMFEERSQTVDNDVRAIHELITSSETLEPVGQEGI
jgi:two-component system, chemotaxis family, protein-glutamate methylesterase/glutaminase